jgi:hypothetical protein
MIDVEKALLDPTAVFSQPKEVLAEPNLSRHQKIEILKRWEYDARELQTADDENMAEGSEVDLLDQILEALHQLQQAD